MPFFPFRGLIAFDFQAALHKMFPGKHFPSPFASTLFSQRKLPFPGVAFLRPLPRSLLIRPRFRAENNPERAFPNEKAPESHKSALRRLTKVPFADLLFPECVLPGVCKPSSARFFPISRTAFPRTTGDKSGRPVSFSLRLRRRGRKARPVRADE